jgi:hypothetical protein
MAETSGSDSDDALMPFEPTHGINTPTVYGDKSHAQTASINAQSMSQPLPSTSIKSTDRPIIPKLKDRKKNSGPSAATVTTPSAQKENDVDAQQEMPSFTGAAHFFPSIHSPAGFDAYQLNADKQAVASFPSFMEMLKAAGLTYRSLLCRKTKLDNSVRKLMLHKSNGTVPAGSKYTVNFSLPLELSALWKQRAIDIAHEANKKALELILDVRTSELATVTEDIKTFTDKQRADAEKMKDECHSMAAHTLKSIIESYLRVLAHENTNIFMQYRIQLKKEKAEQAAKELAKMAAEREVNSNPAASVNAIIDKKMKSIHQDVKSKLSNTAANSKNAQQPVVSQQTQRAPIQNSKNSKKNAKRPRSPAKDNSKDDSIPNSYTPKRAAHPTDANSHGQNHANGNGSGSGSGHGVNLSRPRFQTSVRNHFPLNPNRERLSPQPRFEAQNESNWIQHHGHDNQHNYHHQHDQYRPPSRPQMPNYAPPTVTQFWNRNNSR